MCKWTKYTKIAKKAKHNSDEMNEDTNTMKEKNYGGEK